MDNKPCILPSQGGRQLRPPGKGEGGTSVEECAKLVSTFNREVAVFCMLSVGIGGSNDSERLRDELKNCHQRASELAHQNNCKLIPLLRSKMKQQQGVEGELERLYRLYSGCLELLLLHLVKAANLQREFPMFAEGTVFINTGISEPVVCQRSCVSVEQLDLPISPDKQRLEQEELARLERSAQEIQDIVDTVSQIVDVQPWEIDTDILRGDHLDCRKYSHSTNSDAESTLVITQLSSGDGRIKRKKCVCIAAVSITVAIVCCSVVGLLVGFLHRKT